MKAEAYRIMEDCEQSYWWYRVRREIIADAVARFVPPGARLLDFGCGHGATAERLAEKGFDVLVTDRDDAARAACRARGLSVVEPAELEDRRGEALGDSSWNPTLTRSASEGIRQLAGDVAAARPGPSLALRVSVRDRSRTVPAVFDAILACDVLEHVEDDVGLLSHLGGLLSPEGLVLVTVPAYEFLWSGEDYVSEHVRRYTGRSLVRALRGAGLEPFWVSHFNALLFPPVAAAILGTRLFRPRALYRSNIQPLAPRLDAALGRVFALERAWLKRLRFPFGTSLMAVARRKGADR